MVGAGSRSWPPCRGGYGGDRAPDGSSVLSSVPLRPTLRPKEKSLGATRAPRAPELKGLTLFRDVS